MAKRPPKLCKLCRAEPATVPDRYSSGRPVAEICRDCHARRLAEYLERIAIRWSKGR